MPDRIFTPILFAAAALLAVCAQAREAGGKPDKKDDVNWEGKVVPGPGITLRIKRSVGKVLVYEGSLHRTQESLNSYDEKNTFYLTALCADRSEGLDYVAMDRTYTDRKRTEVLENKKKTERALPNSRDLINLGASFKIVANLRCHAMDGQNRVASRTEQILTLKDGRRLQGRIVQEEADKVVFLTNEEKLDITRAEIVANDAYAIPHVLLNETPHYFFPNFSQKKVSPGDTWKFKVPVIIPIEQGNPPRALPTQFMASMVGRLREVQKTGDRQVAVVEYKVTGQFDTKDDEFSPRFPETFHAANRIVHQINGDGVVSVDVEKGRILEKSETFAITLYASSAVPQPADKPAKVDESKAEIISRYQIKLLPPGTRLPAGAIIPEYD